MTCWPKAKIHDYYLASWTIHCSTQYTDCMLLRVRETKVWLLEPPIKSCYSIMFFLLLLYSWKFASLGHIASECLHAFLKKWSKDAYVWLTSANAPKSTATPCTIKSYNRTSTSWCVYMYTSSSFQDLFCVDSFHCAHQRWQVRVWLAHMKHFLSYIGMPLFIVC